MGQSEQLLSDRLLYVILFAVIVILCVTVYLMVRNIKRNSAMLWQIEALNARYSGYFNFSVKSVYNYTCHKKSKAAYDHTNYRQLLLDYLAVKGTDISKAIALAGSNQHYALEYQAEYQKIRMVGSAYRLYLFQWIERKLCDKKFLRPVTSVSLCITSTYTSPKGRNTYRNSVTFTGNEILRGIESVKEQEQQKQSKQYQRKLMSDSLRYDIMKRDGFRCQLCGASAKDGVKLHVDHIVPVSKGGKTVRQNLRTLCERCNLGKGSKYDYGGPN